MEGVILPPLVNTSIALTIDHCLRNRDRAFVRILETRPLVWIGTLSYSLYLWQQIFINRHSDSWVSRFPLYLPLVLGTAMLSFYLVERPCLRLRARISARGVRPRAHETAVTAP